MESLGDFLKETRTSKGLSLIQIAKDTRIAKRYLEALEEEEFSIFPGEAYLKGFLRTYASYLKLDPNEIIDKYEKIKMAETPTPIEQLIPKPKTNLRPVIAFLIIVLILGGGGYGGYNLYKYLVKLAKEGKFAKKKNKKDKNEATTFNLMQNEDEKIFNVKKDDLIEVEIESNKYTLKVNQLIPVVVVDDTKGHDFYLVKNHLYEIDINNDQNYDVGLYLNYWDKTLANITMTRLNQDNLSEYYKRMVLSESDKAETITTKKEKEKIEFTINVKSGNYFKYKIDDQDEIEGFFNTQSQQNISAENYVIIWMSNAGLMDINFKNYNKLYSPGNPGQIDVKMIRWKKANSGDYELQVSSLK